MFTKNWWNFTIGIMLGVLAQNMWFYSTFLFFTVFLLQVVIIYTLINIPFHTNHAENKQKPNREK